MRKSENFQLISSLIILFIFISYSSNYLLDIDNLILIDLAEKYNFEQIEKFVELKSKWEFIGYILMPIFITLKILLISAILDIGLFFSDIKINYSKIINIVTKSEFVFLFQLILNIYWILFFEPDDYSFEKVQNFSSLSVYSIIDDIGSLQYVQYPLQILNLFEIVYWIILAYLISLEARITLKRGFFVVSSSYGVSLLIWVVAVMFITLNIS